MTATDDPDTARVAAGLGRQIDGCDDYLELVALLAACLDALGQNPHLSPAQGGYLRRLIARRAAARLHALTAAPDFLGPTPEAP